VGGARAGLRDIVACSTEICFIDGDGGRLLYRGYSAPELARRVSFEEVAALLWTGSLPGEDELRALRADLCAAGILPGPVLDLLSRLPRTTGMAALRTAVSALGQCDPEARDGSPEANRRKAVRLAGQVPAVVAAWWRLGRGEPVLEPLPELGAAANFLRLLLGRQAPALHAQAMDAALVLHADHELNASTFAARVTAATLADMHAAVTAAVGALEGPLHGGANYDAVRAIAEIGTPERADGWVRDRLAAGLKVPGFGHAVYHTVDPRAAVLKGLARELGEAAGDLLPYRVAEALEEAVWRQRRLYPNVDLYSGACYHALGIPEELFTPVFAVSRVSGWTAHILEQYGHNRLIRPRAAYVGPMQRELPPARAAAR
jgi:citrate synthase